MSKKLFALLFCAALAGVAHATDVGSAIKALESGDAQRAATILKPLAEKGDPVAQLHFGLMHYNGHGVGEDESSAISWLKKSAAQGNIDAMYQLGNVFTFGQKASALVDDPDLEAAKWYHRAAVAGNRDAQYSLGLMFMSGKGVVKDANEANYWMQQAASGGHPDARSYLGNPGAR